MAQEDEMYLENLDEFINDENKLVTYKWLSRTLSMHVNEAKQVLYKFLIQQRNKKDKNNLSVTYFISGICKENNELVYKVQIVPEEALESSKACYTQLTSCHVYSVQKGKLKDSDLLYTTDYDTMKEHILDSNCFSAVKYPTAKLRTDEEVENVMKIKSELNKSPIKESYRTGGATKTTQKEKAVNKPGTIAGMFAKSTKKPEKADVQEQQTAASKTKTLDKVVSSEGKVKSKPGGVMSFWSKQGQKPKKLEQVQDSRSTNKGKKEEEKPANSCSSAKGVIESRKKKADSDEEDEIHHEKKRRRIKQLITDSSSSEDEMDIDEPIPTIDEPVPSPPASMESDPDEIPPTPSPETRSSKAGSGKVAPGDNKTSGKIQKKKLVSRTFVDDKGFMITEKVYEDQWEDVPDEKNVATSHRTEPDNKETTTSKKTASLPKRVPAAQAGKKQTSLTGFFKKK